MEHHEIERKFLISALPKEIEEALVRAPAMELKQAYLASSPTVRIRSQRPLPDGEASYYLTYKGEPSADRLDREEYNLPLGEKAYQHLLEKVDRETDGIVVEKTRYLLPYEAAGCAYTIELDVFAAPFEGLCYAEVEFDSRGEAEAFVPPAWFGREVTQDKRYSNKALAKTGELPPL